MKGIEIYKKLMDEYLEMYKNKYLFFKERKEKDKEQEFYNRLIGATNICNFMGLLTDKERLILLREIKDSALLLIQLNLA